VVFIAPGPPTPPTSAVSFIIFLSCISSEEFNKRLDGLHPR
jgi:hypothetical protein